MATQFNEMTRVQFPGLIHLIKLGYDFIPRSEVENIKDPENQTLFIAHADCSTEEVNQLKELVKAEIPVKEIEVVYIGPIVGASIGPDAIGLWAVGDEFTWVLGD